MDVNNSEGFKKYPSFSKDSSLIASMYSCHIEYDYFGKGDCIDLSTLEDTYYIYPQGDDFSVTKIALATEELYAVHQETLHSQQKG